jgi:hypothetical protein
LPTAPDGVAFFALPRIDYFVFSMATKGTDHPSLLSKLDAPKTSTRRMFESATL